MNSHTKHKNGTKNTQCPAHDVTHACDKMQTHGSKHHEEGKIGRVDKIGHEQSKFRRKCGDQGCRD